MVRDLLREDGLEWDTGLVRDLFLPQDAEAILSIPISESFTRDRMVGLKRRKVISQLEVLIGWLGIQEQRGEFLVVRTCKKCKGFRGECGA